MRQVGQLDLAAVRIAHRRVQRAVLGFDQDDVVALAQLAIGMAALRVGLGRSWPAWIGRVERVMKSAQRSGGIGARGKQSNRDAARHARFTKIGLHLLLGRELLALLDAGAGAGHQAVQERQQEKRKCGMQWHGRLESRVRRRAIWRQPDATWMACLGRQDGRDTALLFGGHFKHLSF